MVARRAKNLGNMLIQSECTRQTNTSWLTEYPHSLGMFPCSKWQICPFVDRTRTFREAKDIKEYEIRDLINCSTERVIYMLTCPCPKIYIGKTKRQLKIRIGEHLREIKREKDRCGKETGESSSTTLCPMSSGQTRRNES